MPIRIHFGNFKNEYDVYLGVTYILMTHSVRKMIESSAVLSSGTPVYTDNFVLTDSGVLNIYHDLTIEDCDLVINSNLLRQIQFTGGKPSDSTLKLINERLLPSKQNIGLRVIVNGHGAYNNLDFLAYLPNLKNLSADLFNNDEISKINKYLQLETLAIGTQKISIKEIVHQTFLKRLFVFGKPKDIEIVGQMNSIESLTFSMQSLKSIDFLRSLKNLTELHFILGGTRNLDALPDIGKIEKLSFVWVRQLVIENLRPINEMKFLKELSFDTQVHLTNLDWLKNKSIKTEIINCKNFKG